MADTIRVDGDQGYTQFKQRALAPGQLVDAVGAIWKTQQIPDARNKYPVNLGGGRGARIIGGRVLGTNSPDDASWSQRYGGGSNNSAQVCFTNTDEAMIEGFRIHDGWDSIRFAGTAAVAWTVKGCWITNNRDDAVENDSSEQRDGLVDDCLIDGTYVGVSITSGKRRGSLTIRDSLIYLKPMPGAHNDGPALQPGAKALLKVRNGDKVTFDRAVIRMDQPSNINPIVMHIPAENKQGQQTYEAEGRDSVICWCGGGDYPYKYPADIFTVLKGQEAVAYYERWKQNWINEHPEVERFDFDPQPEEPSPVGYEVVRAEDEMLVDGHGHQYQLANPLHIEGPRASLEARVMHNDEALFFWLMVEDPALELETGTDKPWRQDSVEIFLDQLGDGGSEMREDDVQMIATPQQRVWAPGNGDVDLRDHPGAEIASVIDTVAGGYTLELKVPWSSLRPDFNRQGFRLSFVLNDKGEQSVLLGGDTRQFKVPDKWMVSRLVD